jgi:hypothetical protein
MLMSLPKETTRWAVNADGGWSGDIPTEGDGRLTLKNSIGPAIPVENEVELLGGCWGRSGGGGLVDAKLMHEPF